eukprot:jgi/Chlat1/1412/Chrsp12S01986
MDDDAGASGAGEEIRRAFRNERTAPEVLPYAGEQVGELLRDVTEQEEWLDENRPGDAATELASLLQMMDVNRTRYLLRSYLRTRLAKIERHVLFTLKSDQLWNRLSEEEQQFARSYTDVMESALRKTVLEKMPDGFDSLLRQSSNSASDDMIPMPDLDQFVFCRIKDNMSSFQVDDQGFDTADLHDGQVWLLRYKPIRELLLADRLELI